METDSEKENDIPDFPEVNDNVPAKFINSQMGKPLLVDPYNYVYCRMKEVNGKTYWRCQREVSKILPRYLDMILTFLSIVLC
jgi:hypothetical protein